ncbi:MAG TPA: outer membrane protein assembly factor BamD [Nitrospiria bacterium]|nr:outer membrane protein assembly factor BamD [Nitrospiria bacterium]
MGLAFWVCLAVAGCVTPRPAAVATVPIPSVQLEALDEGMKAYEERDYTKALKLFQSVILRFPGSPLLEEAQWMIGKTYESSNEFGRALAEYLSFTANFPNSAHRYEAELRIDFLKGMLRQQKGERFFRRYVGVVLSGDPQAAVGRLDRALQDVPAEGTRVVVLQGYGPGGVYFKTDQASVIREATGDAVRSVHRRGDRVWIRIPIRNLPWFKAPGAERDTRYDPVRKRLEPTDALDFFNPETLGRLERFYLDLAAAGPDGFLIDEDPLIGPWEGFSPTARAAFLLDFGEVLRPDRLIAASDPPGRKAPAPESAWTPLFWQWTGWKNRQVLSHMAEIIKAVRNRYPSVEWVRVVPASAVTQPNVALARSGIDLLEEKLRGFDYFGIAVSADSGPDNPLVVLDRAVDLIGDPKRVIALVPMTQAQWAVSHSGDFQGAGLLLTEAAEAPKTPLTRRRH